MGFLCVTRRDGETLRITIDPGVDTEKLLQQLLRDGITIGQHDANFGQARLFVEAPRQMRILRTELESS